MGGKSGGGGHTPYEAPDNLKSAQQLRAIGIVSLGPIEGPVTANEYESCYFDNTPIQNSDKSWNFQNTKIKYALGTQDQLPLEGFEFSEREVPVGAEVKKDHPIVRSVIDRDVTRLRITVGVNALFHQNDQGDTYGSAVDLVFLINNQPVKTVKIEGKASSRFHRSYILENLPPVPFQLSVRRLTDDSKSQRLQNATFWASYTEIIDTKLSYPNIALAGITTDSRYNPNFPNVNFLLRGRIIKVPSNYNPYTRVYDEGIWRGDFKLAWTNNPAWIFYDIAVNDLAGLGKRLGDYGVDKFQLYQIAKYCDELVPDGYGGMEPRMTANVWITERRDAYAVLSDMASVFRAITVWTGTQFTAIQDRPSDPVCTYTQANVIGGKFARQYAPYKSIFTAAEVECVDKHNKYQRAIEYVSDDEMQKRYGYNVKRIVAFACTSRGQAHRYGEWILATSKLEQCTITFSVGRQGLLNLPGDIIEIADKKYADVNIGGRVLAINGKKVTLDTPIELSGESYLGYLVVDAEGVPKTQYRKIKKLDPNNAAIVELEELPENLAEMDSWALHSGVVKTQLYRVISIAENDDGSYTITALQHEPKKEAIVDKGARFDRDPTTRHKGLSPVSNVDVSADSNGINLTFTTPFFTGQGLRYQVTLYRGGKFYQLFDDLKEPNLAFTGLPNGEYVAEIRAKNGHGQLSEPVSKSFSIQFAVSELVAVSKVFGIGLSWKNPIFANQNAAIEIWTSKENRFETARKLVSLAYPTNSYTYDGLGVAETYYFWARMVDNLNGTAGEFTPVTEGITERSAEKLVDYLEGQLTKDSFSQQLLDGLTKDIRDEIGENNKGIDSKLSQITHGLQQEVANRTAEIQREAQQRTQALQAEARTRGTAIAQLQNVDRTQAQQISQATAKADDALAGVQAERTARIEANRAETVAREALTGRIANAESGLTSLQRTVTQQGQSIAESSQRLNAKIDGLSVGGRNLLLKSLKLDTKWDTYASATIESGVAVLRGSGRLVAFLQSNTPNLNTLSPGRVAISFIAKSNRDARLHVRLRRVLSGNRISDIAAYVAVTSRDFKRYTLELDYRPIDDQVRLNFEIATYEPDGVVFEIKQPKLERGTVATDWSPAPEDVEQSISAVAVDLTEYKSAQATKEQAQAQKVDDLTTRLGAAEGNISNIQSTKASKTEVASIARTALRSEWQSDAQTKADNAKSQAIAEANRLNQATSARIDTIANTLSTATQSAASEISTLRATVSRIDARTDGLVKTEIDLTNFDQNTWYPVIFKGLKTGQTSRFRVSQNLISGLHNPTWASHGTRSFSLLCEWSANGGGWGAINVARVIHNFEYGWVNDRKSPIFTIDQMINSSTEYCRLRGGAKYDVFAPPNITVEKQPNGYSIQQQTISPFVNYYSDRLVPQSVLKKLDASITESKQVTADINGRVQAIHSLRTETIANGRKAIAGITLGSNGGEQSEIILMADKLQLVRNAQDGSPVPMMGVINHNGRTRMALSGDIAVQGDLVGNRFVGGEIDVSGNDGVLRVGRTGRFEVRASQHNRGLVMNNDQILVYDQNGRIRLKIGKL